MRNAILLAGILAAACASLAAAEPKHEFAIYTLASQRTGEWTQVELTNATPVITDADIISYDWAVHSMRVRPETLKRIPRPPVQGTPFVIVADGQRIYLGVFTTCMSSIPASVPSIMADRGRITTNLPADTLVIDPCNWCRPADAGHDPRSDARIKASLSALKKLKGAE